MPHTLLLTIPGKQLTNISYVYYVTILLWLVPILSDPHTKTHRNIRKKTMKQKISYIPYMKIFHWLVPILSFLHTTNTYRNLPDLI